MSGGHRALRTRRGRHRRRSRTGAAAALGLLLVSAVVAGTAVHDGTTFPGPVALDPPAASSDVVSPTSAAEADAAATGVRAVPAPTLRRPRDESPGPPAEGAPIAGSAPRAGSASVPIEGPGVFDVVAPGPPAREDEPEGTAYTVEVERNLPFDRAGAAARVGATLDDARGWSSVLGVRFRPVRTSPDLRIIIATPTTTDRLCAPLLTRGRVSCRNGDLVVINALRWARGTPDYRGRLTAYRRYVVNHEVGHSLGQGHAYCPAPGQPAPVMQQQTYGLEGCLPNPWPGTA